MHIFEEQIMFVTKIFGKFFDDFEISFALSERLDSFLGIVAASL